MVRCLSPLLKLWLTPVVEFARTRREELAEERRKVDEDELAMKERHAREELEMSRRKIAVSDRQNKFERERVDFARRDKLLETEEDLARMDVSWLTDTGLEFLVDGVNSSELDSVVEAGPSRIGDNLEALPGNAPGS